MIFILITIVLSLLLGAVSFFAIDTSFIAANAAALLATLSVFAAGILVRLNRGVPAVDWKSVNDVESVEELLQRLETISKEYIGIFCVIVLEIMVVFSAAYTHAREVDDHQVIATAFGGIFGFLIGRMIYIVWRDLDIVRLQSAIIVAAAYEERGKKEVEAASSKLATMTAARIPREAGPNRSTQIATDAPVSRISSS